MSLNTITSYLVGEGIRNTYNGNYAVAFEELDETFGFLPGTVADIREDIRAALCKTKIIEDVAISGETFVILFNHGFWKYSIKCV